MNRYRYLLYRSYFTAAKIVAESNIFTIQIILEFFNADLDLAVDPESMPLWIRFQAGLALKNPPKKTYPKKPKKTH
jgi:hypothetical protein